MPTPRNTTTRPTNGSPSQAVDVEADPCYTFAMIPDIMIPDMQRSRDISGPRRGVRLHAVVAVAALVVELLAIGPPPPQLRGFLRMMRRLIGLR